MSKTRTKEEIDMQYTHQCAQGFHKTVQIKHFKNQIAKLEYEIADHEKHCIALNHEANEAAKKLEPVPAPVEAPQEESEKIAAVAQ